MQQNPVTGIGEVIIGMPVYRDINPTTVISLVTLLEVGRPHIRGCFIKPFVYIDQSRNDLVRQALEVSDRYLRESKGAEITHLLFLDSDMLWPPNTVSRLLLHDMAVVGGAYFLKTPPHDCIAFNFDSQLKVNRLWRGEDITELPLTPTPLIQVNGLGLGCTLIKLDVFRRMKDHFSDEKWFSSEECGEDVHFFRRLHKMGTPVYMDCGLICGHIGEQIVDTKQWSTRYQRVDDA